MNSLKKTVLLIAGLSGAALLLVGYSYNMQKNKQRNDTTTETISAPATTPTPESVTPSSPSTMGSGSYSLQGTTGAAATAAPSTKDDTDSIQKDLNAVQIDADFGAKVQ